jgi:xylulokinase
MIHDPEVDWWGAVARCIEVVTRELSGRQIEGVGLSGLFPAHCVVDRRGRAISPGFLYGDRRAAAHNNTIGQVLGRPMVGDEVFPRLVWHSFSDPALLVHGNLALSPTGYVGLRLTGDPFIDPQSAFRWGCTAASGETWDGELIRRFKLPLGMFPPIRKPRMVVGTVTRAAAEATGLMAGVPVVAGLTDSAASLVGHGVVRRREAAIYYGSSPTLLVLTEDLGVVLDDPKLLSTVCPWRLALYAVNLGVWLKQLGKTLGQHGLRQLDTSALEIAPGSAGVTVIPPALTGPGWAPGAIIGLSLAHRPGHIWRAGMESLGYLLAEALETLTLPPDSVTAAGGGSRSRVWRQIVSDITGCEQRTVHDGAATKGAAMMACLGAAPEMTLEKLAEEWIRLRSSRSIPDPERNGQYQTLRVAWQAARATTAAGGETSTGHLPAVSKAR